MQTKVKRRPFGNTGLYVSEVALGAMNLRMLENSAEGKKQLHFVLDQGITLIDTARAYNGVTKCGEPVESERLVGEVLRERTDIDEPIVIVTKGHAYTPEGFDEDFSTSIRTLGVEKRDGKLYIGNVEIKLVYFFHGIKEDRWLPMVQTNVVEYAKKRQADGDFTYLGFSAHYGDAEQIKWAIDTGAMQVMELPYNVYNRSIGEDGEFDALSYAHERGVAIINMKCFNGNGMVPATKIIREVCNIDHSDMLRFSLSNPNISCIDAGARYIEEFAADIEASLKPAMTLEERQTLKEKADQVSGLFHNICRECMHCLEKFACPQGIAFPEILGIHARYTMAKALDADAKPYIDQYKAMSGPLAEACVGCGGCSQWCEYHLDIPEMMQKVLADFE